VYEYFKNKEDIVFEIIRNYIDTYHQDFNSKFDSSTSTKEKVVLLFGFLFSDNELLQQLHI
jgi:AcrR family transcriptional regulator